MGKVGTSCCVCGKDKTNGVTKESGQDRDVGLVDAYLECEDCGKIAN